MVRVWFGTILLTEFCASVNRCHLSLSSSHFCFFFYFLATLLAFILFDTNTINKLVNSLSKLAITLTKLPTKQN